MCFVLLMGVDLQTCIVYRCARHNSHQLVWVCSHAIVDSPVDISCTVWHMLLACAHSWLLQPKPETLNLKAFGRKVRIGLCSGSCNH